MKNVAKPYARTKEELALLGRRHRRELNAADLRREHAERFKRAVALVNAELADK